MNMDRLELFYTLHPGFFEKEGIRRLAEECIFEEQILDLHGFSQDALEIPCPGHITFGLYEGDPARLHGAVSRVDEGWLEYYPEGSRPVYCAFHGEKVVSFCLLDDFGSYKGFRIGGPGCVGTVPEYRKQGIGLKMVQLATAQLKAMGYDMAYIHYTGVGKWYARLGYETILKWNSQGIVGP